MSGTTTNYAWTYPTSTDYVKDGASAIQTLATGIDTTLGTALNNKVRSGLTLIKTQTIGSAVSSVTVTNAFSATYNNYKIVITGCVGSTSLDIGVQFGASNTGYYQTVLYANYGTTGTTSDGQTNYSQYRYAATGDANGIHFDIDVFSPFQAAYTRYAGKYINATIQGNSGGMHKVATSYTDFTLLPSTGTLTGGTIAIYGYGLA